ncbi:MAG TPA: 3,4-dioxygenase subunit beta [Dermatophilaceae bacterium]|nr:3,4-dioxygenase subunit beta [Dermatophilaceae bacterium]
MTEHRVSLPAERTAKRTYDHAPGRHDLGLTADVRTLLHRRQALALLGGAGLVAIVGCSAEDNGAAGVGDSSTSSTSAMSSTDSGSTGSAGSAGSAAAKPAAEVPDETAGPYPGDGSNGVDVLDDSDIVRRDITSSFGTSTTRAAGIPLVVNLTVTDAANGYAAMAGAAVYLWHCDINGEYSMYSQGLEDESYLRGVQATNRAGTATFTSIFPGAYPGRWPHIHFEVYRSVRDATNSGPIVKTSQVALPEAACREAYATNGYGQSLANLSRMSLASDNVFGNDGGIYQLATMTGAPGSGYVANLTIGV